MAGSNKSLSQQVSRLTHDHPTVRRYAVATLFDLLAQHNTYTSKAGRDALKLCLQQPNKVRMSDKTNLFHRSRYTHCMQLAACTTR